jgi:hypothetical protein
MEKISEVQISFSSFKTFSNYIEIDFIQTAALLIHRDGLLTHENFVCNTIIASYE